ncbi:MAG TPA: hypothetical protein VF152_14380 [Acidimicrobiia bacterium]
MALAALPRRDEQARTRLEAAARRASPTVLAREQVLPVPGELGALVPALQRGSVVAVGGEPGAGATTVALGLAAAATAAGTWAAAVEVEVEVEIGVEVGSAPGLIGGLAAAEAGVALDRFTVVRRVPPTRWATVVAALLDGIELVVTEVPPHARAGDARRLAARARERGVVLAALGAWPAEAAVRLWVDGTTWTNGDRSDGLLAARELRVRVEGRAAPAVGIVPLARTG